MRRQAEEHRRLRRARVRLARRRDRGRRFRGHRAAAHDQHDSPVRDPARVVRGLERRRRRGGARGPRAVSAAARAARGKPITLAPPTLRGRRRHRLACGVVKAT